MDKEMEAIAGCVKALEPIAHDKQAIHRAISYLTTRFKPAPTTRSIRVRTANGEDHLVGNSGPGGQPE